MEYKKAAMGHAEQIYQLVQDTITAIYPNYYPREVVDFFCQLHNKENIIRDMESGNTGILTDNNQLIGTGSYQGNHITRVYVNPNFQRQGYGSAIIQSLEKEIAFHYDMVCLDASLPACHLYETKGYETVRHEKQMVGNGVILVYEIMQKHLPTAPFCYNGKSFVSKTNTANGEVGEGTLFLYRQSGAVVWADYTGGGIIKGHLVGTVAKNGELDFYYQHINTQKQVGIGKCHSVPHVLENGKTELWEE